MNSDFRRKVRGLMLPGLKRWILILLIGISVIVIGALLLLGYHPLTVSGMFLREIMEHAADVLPNRISGLIVITGGGLVVCLAVAKVTLSVLGAYLPDERDPIPDVLYRRRHLQSGPRVAVIGGGTGLSTLLKGLKYFTSNITAIVTVGDDGGSSGRLRAELGVIPPGDIRNCITALADEEELVTELFSYRFEQGEGLEGHSFGNLFLTALYRITEGDFLESVRVASRVLKSRGQVLPATLSAIQLVAELEDGRTITGESNITSAGGKIKRLLLQAGENQATPQALEAIMEAELIVLGPGSLYTSIIPNLLVPGVSEAIRKSKAKKLYVCNVMTQKGETSNYSVADHVEAILLHSGTPLDAGFQLVDAVLVNDQPPVVPADYPASPVTIDQDRLRKLAVIPIKRPLVTGDSGVHHDPARLSKIIMLWFYRAKRRKPVTKAAGSPESGKGAVEASEKVTADKA
ncbi:MAG: YvcK family protein [Candidatus Melainabacteria bacterium]|nr:YvcK family protein [Candidatus Melainabacteria bacterium]